jgi:hypothetical protein
VLDFLKQKYSVCAECGVHFEPVTGHESKWGNLCAVHRKPVKERDEKKTLVIDWATANWEKLYDTAKKEVYEQREAYNKLAQSSLSNIQSEAQRQAAMSQSLGSGLSTSWPCSLSGIFQR